MRQLAFELAEAPVASGAMVIHQCAVQRPAHPHPRGGHSHDNVAATPALPVAGARPYPLNTAGTVRPRAARLGQQLHAVEAPAELRSAALGGGDAAGLEGSSGRNVLAALPTLAARVGSAMRPKGTTHNDDTLAQRLVNVATSLPFLAVGAHMMRTHQTPEGRRYAASVLAVGTAATAYHASSGPARTLLRKVDYWTITASSTTLMKALWPSKPLVHHALNVSALAIPFKPFFLSTAHTLIMQAEFARQAATHAGMRPQLRRHLAAAAVGTALFALEDVMAENGFGHMHAAWHCLAACGLATTGALVRHKEQLRLTAASMTIDAATPLRPCHDSAASLRNMDKGSASC